MSTLIENMKSEMALTVLGCGRTGIAILSEIFGSLNTAQAPIPILVTTSGTSTPACLTEPPTHLPSKFITCVCRAESPQKVQQALSPYLPTPFVTILQGENVLAVQTMRGAAGLILSGEHPALLRDRVSTPGGCTIGGLLVLEEGRVRGPVARAVREATVVAGKLGKGVVGVNGTRF